MPVHSAFNPFGAKVPLRKFGNIDIQPDGKLSFNGLPYVGPVVDFKDDDPQDFQPQQQFNGCVAQFDLSKPEDMEQYRALLQKFCAGQALLSNEEKIYDNDIKSWRILIRWMEPYYAPPEIVKQMVEEEKRNPPPPPKIMPETDLSISRDSAEVRAAIARGEDEGSRYATINEVIHTFGALQDGEE